MAMDPKEIKSKAWQIKFKKNRGKFKQISDIIILTYKNIQGGKSNERFYERCNKSWKRSY